MPLIHRSYFEKCAKSLRYFVIVIALATLFSCSQHPITTADSISKNTLLFHYHEFGPSYIAEEILGPYIWQWDDPDNYRPGGFDIKAVVYRGVSISEVKNTYPIDPKNKQDYRYVEYTDAIKWFDKHIGIFNERMNIDGAQGRDIGSFFGYLRDLYTTSLTIERGLRH